MAEFLDTTATSYQLERLIKGARDRLILISPFLQFNNRIKELIEDKNNLKIDVRVVYGKNELKPGEMTWLKGLSFVRTSFCEHLHAKCYLNETHCIITSMNLYAFSQANNNEMGVLLARDSEPEVYNGALSEAQRLIRISEDQEVVFIEGEIPEAIIIDDPKDDGKLTTSKLAKLHKLKTDELVKRFASVGFLKIEDGKQSLTDAGRNAGGERRFSKRFGQYFLWPRSITVPHPSGS